MPRSRIPRTVGCVTISVRSATAFDLAGADESTTRTWLRDWSLALDGDTYVARIAARDFALDLRFRATQSSLVQGDGGYSRKGPLPTQASYYYSRPQLEVSGRVAVDGRAREVSGRAWLDHEWSSEVWPRRRWAGTGSA